MFWPKLFTLGAVVAPAIAVIWLQQQSMAGLRSDNAAIRQSIAALHRDANAAADKRAAAASASDQERAPRSAASSDSIPSLPSAPSANQLQPDGTNAHVALSKANLKRLRLKPLNHRFELTDEACAVLGLSVAERSSLNQAAANLLSAQQQMDAARLKPLQEHLTDEQGRKTTFHVAAYPDEGKKLAANLMQETQRVIGQERAELLFGFADLNSLSAEGYEPFGRTEKTITFLDRENPDGTRADCRIFMEVRDVTTGFTLSTSFENQEDRIPIPWKHLIQNAAAPK